MWAISDFTSGPQIARNGFREVMSSDTEMKRSYITDCVDVIPLYTSQDVL
jgi:hypothetical protein